MRRRGGDEDAGGGPATAPRPTISLPVLVLNASMEPLSIVPTRRAVVLTLAQKAEVMHEDGRWLRSESLRLRAPTVVRLQRQVRVPVRRRAGLSRRAVLLRDGQRCQYCGGTAEDVDHVVPRSRGGAHAWENVVAACRRCNSHKQDRTPREAGLRLAREPAAPPSAFWLLARVGELDEAWRGYLAPYLGARWTPVLDLLPLIDRR